MKTPTLSDISAICIDGLEQQCFILNGERKDTLSGTNMIDVLIGENSAGKSRFLRAIFTRPVNHINIKADLKGKLKDTLIEIKSTIYNREVNKEILEEITSAPLESGLKDWVYETVGNYYLKTYHRNNSDQINTEVSKALGEPLLTELNKVADLCVPTLKLLKKRTYIPILRGLRPLDPKKDLFKERTYNDYLDDNKKTIDEYDIFTGYSLYSDIMHSLLGLEEERKSIKRFENYLSKYFFERKPVTLIPKKDREGAKKPNDVVFVKIGTETMLPIYELGDGIQAIITLTVRPFLTQEPTVFFIEEPEQHLHAGMQRALIQAFRACPQHKYFFTTQSNHFIDLSLESDDISLFSVKKTLDDEHNSKSEVTNQRERADILKDLGVLASSVLLANCSIWVEGITDKLYLRIYLQRFIEDLKAKSESSGYSSEEKHKFLQRYNTLISFNENLHYVFVEYQGSNITHWDFANSDEDPDKTPAHMLNKDIFLLADNDIDSKGDRVAHLRDALGNNFHLLEWKEIENYIPQNVILETAEQRWGTFRCTGKEESSFDPSLFKTDAFKLTTGIGQELEKAVKRSDSVDSSRQFFEDSSGTIKDKVKFCETACSIMKNDEVEWVLSPELETLCDAIWSFVEKNNKI